MDDAYISARYAEQFAAGNGLVYNAGLPPVEGYTNLLWTVTLGVLIRLGAPVTLTMEAMGYAYGLLGLLGVVLVTDRLANQPARPWISGIPAVFLAATPHYTVVSTNGLETSQFIAWTFLSLAVLWTEGRAARLGAAALFAGLVLVRPEGILVALGALLFDHLDRRSQWRDPWQWSPLIATLSSAATLQAWRLATYGVWVPNTAAAKADLPWTKALEMNARYLGGDADFWIPFAVLAVGALALTRWSWRSAALVALSLGLTLIASRVYLWMPGSRLMVLPMALLLPLFAVPLQAVRGPWTWRSVGATAFALLFAALFVYVPWGWTTTWQRGRDFRHSVSPDNPARYAGFHLAKHLRPGSYLATRDAGLLAWSVGTDIHVAELHERALTQPHPEGADSHVPDFCPERPEVIVLTVNTSDRRPFYYPRERTLWENWTGEYHYLGRVEQHYRRHYDFYVRADLNVPPLDPALVTNHVGLLPRTEPRGTAGQTRRSPDGADGDDP